jgi:CotH protein
MRVFARQLGLAVTMAVLAAALTVRTSAQGWAFGAPQQEVKVVERFDTDGDKRLNAEERRAARASMGRWSSPPGRMGFALPAATPGPRLMPSHVKSYRNEPAYDLATLRTFFVRFDAADWEQELMAFYNTDVEVPANVTVDGTSFRDVGVHFRGMSSYRMVPEGFKHSLNLSFDWMHDKQDLGGYQTFNLLNSNNDPTFVRTVLYSEISRHYIPTPKTNYVRVAINGESWGVYVNAQQFNSDFVREWFGTRRGARWKVPGSPRGRGGLEYLGEDVAAYKRLYEIRTDDDAKAWADLIALCRVLNTTPPEKLEDALAPVLDVDATLRFLALEVAMVNSDGYLTRASDYNLYQDVKGRFHVVPHDVNEALGSADLRGGFGAGDGVELDPLVGVRDTSKPLRSKLLAVPALRARYLGYVRDIAQQWLDWTKLEPMVTQYQALIAADVKTDTRKLGTFEAFYKGVASLRTFVEERRDFLLKYDGPGSRFQGPGSALVEREHGTEPGPGNVDPGTASLLAR